MSEYSPDAPFNPPLLRTVLNEGQSKWLNGYESWFSRKLGADIVGIIEFPGEAPKQVAVVDYGQNFVDKSLVPEGGGMGRPETRWGLRGMNYQHQERGMVYASLPEGPSLILGRDASVSHNDASYRLGLTEAGNDLISRRHVKLRVARDIVQVTNISKNFTTIYSLDPEA
jgi:hypothetical protein